MNRSLKLVTISLFIWGLGEGMFLMFQPLYLQKLGADPITIGAILGGMGFMTTISQIPSGYLSDKFGPSPLMWVSWVWGTLAAMTMALSSSLVPFVVALLLYGLTGSVLAPMNAYITVMKGDWTAERALTFTSAAFHLGFVVGPTLGGFLGQNFDFQILYVIASFLFIISTILVLFIEKPKIEIHHDIGLKTNIFKNLPFLRIVGLGAITLFFMVFTQSFTPVYLEELRSTNMLQIGYLGTIGSLGNVLLALSLGHLSARIGYFVSIPLVFLFPILIWKSTGFFGFGLAYFMFGGYRLARSMLLALGRSFVHSKDTGLAYGIIETANGVATILAPVICGIIYNQNPQHIYTIALVGLFSVMVINLLLLPKENKNKDEI
ncbi:MAG: MFS transporter [Anaerolineaceae bacterium]